MIKIMSWTLGETAENAGAKFQSATLNRRRSTKLTIRASSDARSTAVVYHSDRQALSAAQLGRASQLATADTR